MAASAFNPVLTTVIGAAMAIAVDSCSLALTELF
jgi:hypothetical protein